MHFRRLSQFSISHALLQRFISCDHQAENRKKCSNRRHVVISHVAQKIPEKIVFGSGPSVNPTTCVRKPTILLVLIEGY
jgi:hypothetical protein